MSRYLFSLSFLLFISVISTVSYAADQDVRLSVVGYLPSAQKVASLTAFGATFLVKRASDDAIVFEGIVTEDMGEVDGLKKVTVYPADFSAVTEPGIYYLEVPGVGKSRPFPISEDVYLEPFKTAMLGFYGWRSSIDISLTHGGQTFSHAAGHLDDGYLDYAFLEEEDDGEPEIVDAGGDGSDFFDGGSLDGGSFINTLDGGSRDLFGTDSSTDTAMVNLFKDGIGGWYDAGDYGKYVPNGGFAVGLLMAAWEDFEPALSQISLEIPEKDNGVPDFLDEIRWEIEWLLKMQFEDGSVSHKLTSTRFSGNVLPAHHDATRYFVGYSTFATATFVAAIAQAARIFRPYDEAFADTCLNAALHSYQFLQDNPENKFANDEGFSTGTYQTNSSRKDLHARFWAAAEVWETTGDAAALDDFETRALEYDTDLVKTFAEWSDQKMMGVYTYLRSAREGKNPDLLSYAQERMVAIADAIDRTARSSSGFGRGLADDWWGSNGVVARLCMSLVAGHRISQKQELIDTCGFQLDHLYGRNYFGRPQVTGVGLYPPCHPHDRRSVADNVVRPYPGLLVGGGGHENLVWVDDASSYETNEVAINWNGALVYALASRLTATNTDGPSSVGFVPDVGDCTTEPPPPPLPAGADIGGPEIPIDDFEDGDDQILVRDGRNGRWTAFDDGTNGENSGFNISTKCRSGSTRCSSFTSVNYTAKGAGIEAQFYDDGTGESIYNGSDYTGVSFWAKAAKESIFRVYIVDENTTSEAYAEFTATNEWQNFVYAFEQFKGRINREALFGIQFKTSTGGPHDMVIDDIAFTTATGYTPKADTPTPPVLDAGTDSGLGKPSDGDSDSCSCDSVGKKSEKPSLLKQLFELLF